MDIFVLMQIEMYKYDHTIKCISLKFFVLLSWFNFAQKDVTPLYLYIWVFRPY